MAVLNINSAAAEYLVSKGAEAGRPNEDGLTPLHIAAREGSCLKFAEHVVRTCEADIINRGDGEYDESAIHWACERGQEEIVEILIKSEKVDLNRPATKWRNFTSLHVAIRSNHPNIVKVLLDNPNADPSWKHLDEAGKNPFELAIQNGTDDCIIAVFSHSRIPLDEQIEAVKRLCGAGVEKRSSAGAVLMAVLKNGNVSSERVVGELSTLLPLHLLAHQGDADTIKALVKAGINAFATDSDGWTFFDIAHTYGRDSFLNDLGDIHTSFRSGPDPPVPLSFPIPTEKDMIRVVDCSEHSQTHQGVIGKKRHICISRGVSSTDTRYILEFGVGEHDTLFKTCLQTDIPPSAD